MKRENIDFIIMWTIFLNFFLERLFGLLSPSKMLRSAPLYIKYYFLCILWMGHWPLFVNMFLIFEKNYLITDKMCCTRDSLEINYGYLVITSKLMKLDFWMKMPEKVKKIFDLFRFKYRVRKNFFTLQQFWFAIFIRYLHKTWTFLITSLVHLTLWY